MTEPSPMATPDLGALLRRPDRTARVPPTAARPADPQPASQPTDRDKPAGRERVAGQSTERSAKPAAPIAHSTVAATSVPPRQYLRQIAVYLPRSVHQLLRTKAGERSTTATALMLSAVNATHDRLPTHLSARAFAGSSDLFAVPQSQPAAEPTTQTTIRVTDAQLRALTELSARLGVNRSELMATAVRLYLA